MYKREAELEGDVKARKGREGDVDPEGEDDDPMIFEIEMDDKETQTGNDMAEKHTQVEIKRKNSFSQTGRNMEKVSSDDFGMVSSGLYLNIRAGRKQEGRSEVQDGRLHDGLYVF